MTVTVDSVRKLAESDAREELKSLLEQGIRGEALDEYMRESAIEQVDYRFVYTREIFELFTDWLFLPWDDQKKLDISENIEETDDPENMATQVGMALASKIYDEEYLGAAHPDNIDSMIEEMEKEGSK